MNTIYKIEHSYYIEETHSYITSSLSYSELGCLVGYMESILEESGYIDITDNEYENPRISEYMLTVLFPVETTLKTDAKQQDIIILDAYLFCGGPVGYDETVAKALLNRFSVTEQKIIDAFLKARMINESQLANTDDEINYHLLYRTFIRGVANEWLMLANNLASKKLSLKTVSDVSDDELQIILKNAGQWLLNMSRQNPLPEQMNQAMKMVSKINVTLFSKGYGDHYYKPYSVKCF